MGTLLIQRGVPANQCLEELCLTRPELIQESIEITCTLSAQMPFVSGVMGSPVGSTKSIGKPRNSQGNRPKGLLSPEALVPGVSSEAAIAQEIDREECLRTQIGALLDSDVDLIFLETFQDLDELLLALA